MSLLVPVFTADQKRVPSGDSSAKVRLRLSRSERMSETRKAASIESARRPPATGSGEAQRYRTLRALVEVSAVEAGSVVYCCTLVYARRHEGHVLDCGRGGCARAVPSTHDPAMDLEPEAACGEGRRPRACARAGACETGQADGWEAKAAGQVTQRSHRTHRNDAPTQKERQPSGCETARAHHRRSRTTSRLDQYNCLIASWTPTPSARQWPETR